MDNNLPWEAEDQLADEMWWIWESDIDSGSKNGSDPGSESDDNVLELIPIISEPQGSRSPPREEADASGPVINAPDFESSSPEPESSRRCQREENDNGDSQDEQEAIQVLQFRQQTDRPLKVRMSKMKRRCHHPLYQLTRSRTEEEKTG